MIWIVLLIIMVMIGGAGVYKRSGENYSAGRGFFTNSKYNLDDSQKELSDYDPWEYKDLRK